MVTGLVRRKDEAKPLLPTPAWWPHECGTGFPGPRQTPAQLTWRANLCPAWHITRDTEGGEAPPPSKIQHHPPQKEMFKCFLIIKVTSEPWWRCAVCTADGQRGG